MEEEEEVNSSEQDEDLEAQVEPLLARQRLAIIHLKLRQTISQKKLNVSPFNVNNDLYPYTWLITFANKFYSILTECFRDIVD